MKRRETYATSGTRPIVRFFAGEDYPPDLCATPDMIEQAYARGVPMGGELDAPVTSPDFFVSATKDASKTALDLQRVQVIKGWLDAQGNTQERVFDVAGSADTGASVDPNTCTPTGSGYNNLCTVWQDPDYNARQPAFYYVRVLENPSCRWSTRQCQAAGVNPFANDCTAQATEQNARMDDQGAIGDVYSKCCVDAATEPFYSPVLQERAWTSPIWINSTEHSKDVN